MVFQYVGVDSRQEYIDKYEPNFVGRRGADPPELADLIGLVRQMHDCLNHSEQTSVSITYVDLHLQQGYAQAL